MGAYFRSIQAVFIWAALSASVARAEPDSDVLTAFSNAFRRVSAKGGPAVFHVAAEGGSMSKEDAVAYKKTYGDPFHLFDDTHEGLLLTRIELPAVAASGTAWRKEGYIVTCNHVVAHRAAIVVTDSEQREFTATLVAADVVRDIAVLKVDAALQPAALGSSSSLRQGDWIVALGTPFGPTQTMIHGIVSAISRIEVKDAADSYRSIIQTDALFYTGSSGGPVLNLQGEVVGIVNAAEIGYAVPVETVEKVVKDLVEVGRVNRPWLGFSVLALNREEMDAMQISHPSGVLIEALLQGEPAHQAGLEVGDVITRLGQARVRSVYEISNLLFGGPLDSEVKIEYFRDGIKGNVTAKLAKSKDDEEVKKLTFVRARKFARLGCTVAQQRVQGTSYQYHYTENRPSGEDIERTTKFPVFVSSIEAGSELRPGEQIVRLNGKEIRSLANLGATLAALPKETETIEVVTKDSGSNERTLQMQLRNSQPESR